MTWAFPGSIRLRITAIAAAVVAVVLATTGIVLVSVQRVQLQENLDNSLAQRAETVAAALLEGGPHAAFASSDEEDRFVQLIADGEVVDGSPRASRIEPVLAAERPGAHTVEGLALEDDVYRVLGMPLGDGRLLVVGENIDDVNDAVRILAWSLLAAIPLVVAMIGALVWWLVGRTLRPVETIRAEVAEIRGGALDRRVPIPGTADEIAGLARTMNEMLDRVEEASLRQESFVADASHELRTPLARLRTELEVELGRGDNDLRATASSALEDVVDLQRMVDDLLHLARADAGAVSSRRVPVDLDDIVLREARQLRESTPLVIDTSAVSAGHLVADPAQLIRVVRNLAENAARHASSRVGFGVSEHAGAVRLVVEDDGPGRAASELDRMFDRFTRFDESRTTATGSTGLGLAIVRDIAERHGGAAWAETRAPNGLRVVVELPQRSEPDTTG